MTRLAMSVVLCVTLAGCGSSHELSTVPVRVTVTLDGQPVTQGAVHFLPERGRLAKGKIEPDGAAELGTYGEHDGVIIGKHKIAVVVVEKGPPGPGDGGLPTYKWLIPEHYGSPDTSGLTCELSGREQHVVRIELSTDGADRVVVE